MIQITDIPPRMTRLPRDRRGLPVPVIVYVDQAGAPHFTVNNPLISETIIREHRCGICGHKLGPVSYFIGGPQSAFHERGLYFDPAMHPDCARFALRTCPWLAVPRWAKGKRLDGRTLNPATSPDVLGLIDPTIDPDRPAVFVMGGTSGYTRLPAPTEGHYLKPRRPWRSVSFWLNGEEIDAPAARSILGASLDLSDLKFLETP